MGRVDDVFLRGLPQMDLHGYDRDMARVATLDFITENVLMGHKKCVIIHGIGDGIVKKAVHDVLRNNRNVSEFFLDSMNIGCTIVLLGIDKQM